MRHVIASLLLLSCLSALPGCDRGAVLLSAPLPAETASFADFPEVRVQHEKTWRNARELPEGRTNLLLSEGQPGKSLRFAILPGASDVRMTAFVGPDAVASETFTAGKSWRVARYPLNQKSEDEPVVLALESTKSFHLASAEVIASRQSQPNVIVYLIDTLRMDQLQPYGYPLDTSPNIAAFANDGAYVQHLVPMSSWTRASVASLFTGVHTNTHGAEEIPDKLRPNLPGLAKQLQASGYETHGLITNPNCVPEYGFGEGFDDYRDVLATTQRPGWQRDEEALSAAGDIVRNAAGRPFYLYMHTMAPHRDYDAPEKYASKFMPDHYVGPRLDARYHREMALYNGEILFSDMIFGKLMETLKNEQLYDDTLVVLLSDHGEAFNEHGELGHGMSLFEEEIQVPCIIKLPGAKTLRPRVGSQVHMVDMAPTILDLVNVPLDERFEGVSFAPLLTGQGTFSEVPAFLELRINDRHRFAGKTRALKYVYNVVEHTFAWYRSSEDKGEHFPLQTPPPNGGKELRRFAHLESMRGAPGLHLRAAWSTRNPELTFEIGLGTEGPDNIYVSTGHTRIERRGKILRVYWTNDAPPGPWKIEPVEMFAHIENLAGSDTSVGIIDERANPVPFGADPTASIVKNGTKIWTSAALLADDRNYSPSEMSVSDGVALSLWRLPDKESPVVSQQRTETMEALEALGYLN